MCETVEEFAAKVKTKRDYLQAMTAKQQERIAELATHGIKAESGPWLGYVNLSAGNIEKLLRLLRKVGT